VVHGFGPDSAGEFLTRHPDVNGITFTGETRTGTAIMKAAAEGIRPVSLELGGKNAAIVFADCDFDGRHRHPLVLRERRPGLPGHRARVCGAPDLRQVRRRLEGKAEAMKPGLPFDPPPRSAR
jgi:aminomuconate-semialdehyde/2-hydroxymuconate-6-semialdehyde dehydrogenase